MPPRHSIGTYLPGGKTINSGLLEVEAFETTDNNKPYASALHIFSSTETEIPVLPVYCRMEKVYGRFLYKQ